MKHSRASARGENPGGSGMTGLPGGRTQVESLYERLPLRFRVLDQLPDRRAADVPNYIIMGESPASHVSANGEK